MDKLKAEAAKYAIQEEDVLTYAMFPQVAPKFFEKRNARLQGVDALHADYENKSHPVPGYNFASRLCPPGGRLCSKLGLHQALLCGIISKYECTGCTHALQYSTREGLFLTVLRYIVPPEANCQRLGIFLRTQGVTSALIKSVKYNGDGFFADGAPLRTDQPVHPGQQISFALPPEPPTSVTPQPVPFAIAYEDEFAAVLEKPAGIAVHPTLNYPDGTLANGWLYHLQQQGKTGVFRPVNRIDKNTSGLVLCAQNSFAAPLLADSAQKCYLAIVQGILPIHSASEALSHAAAIPSSAAVYGRTANTV